MEIHQFTLDKMSSLLNERVNWVGLFRLLKGLSRMLENSQVRFLGGKGSQDPELPGVLREIMAYSQYKLLVIRVWEKTPFNKYLTRLWMYICCPRITNTHKTTVQLEHSLLDVFSGLGAGAALIGLLILLDKNNSHLEVIKAISPLYAPLSYLIYAVSFSSVVALINSTIIELPISRNKQYFRENFYKIFTHSLRFYAAMGFFLAPFFIYGFGELTANLKTPEQVFSSNIVWFFIIFVTLVWFPFRLQINPIFKFIDFSKGRPLSYVIVLLSVVAGTEANKFIPASFKERIIDKSEICQKFQEGYFYQRLNLNDKRKAKELFCEKDT